MSNIKIRYVLKGKHDGRIHLKWYYLTQVETGGLANLFDVYNYEIIARDSFIGHHDKNGREIYENDIVRIQCPDGGDFEDTIGRVFYDELAGSYFHGNTKQRPPKRLWEHSTVIGDIYSNRDLWEQIQEAYGV